MSATHQPLEHFYTGLSPNLGDGKFQQTVLAASPTVKNDTIERLVARYGIQRNGVAQSFSILRDSIPNQFFAVHIQRGSGGQPIAHYILLPSKTLRENQGNLRAIMRLMDQNAPSFPPTRQTLSPLLMPMNTQVTPAEQAKDILNLLTTLQNKMPTLEALLSAVVQGVRLIVQNAPIDVAQRTGFIEGLLAMLPPSVRFAVTFAGDIAFHTDIDAQIYFPREETTATDVVRYDWQSGQIFGVPLKDEYSRFTISQLRLDTSLVIERTRSMNQPAAWYLSERHTLAEALAYASYRLKVDQALMANQPVNKEDISNILSTDPTLPDSLRASYARYLLRMAMAMQAADEADPIAEMFAKQPELEREAFEQMAQSLDDKATAPSVFRAVSRWFARAVTLPNRARWAQLAQRAALTAAQHLTANRDLAGIAALADDINASSHILDLQPVSRPLLESLIPFATQGADLTERIFVLVASLVDSDSAQQFIAAPALRGMLPQDIYLFMSALHPQSPPPAPDTDLLMNAVRALGSRWESILVSQFGLWARKAGRITMLSESAFETLARHALEHEGPLRLRLHALLDQLSTEELTALGPKRGMYLMRIKLALADHKGLAQTIRQQVRIFYLGEAQIKYIFVLERVFAETANTPEAALQAIQKLTENNIQNVPIVMAGLGALLKRPPHPATDELADYVASVLHANPLALDVVPPQSLMRLVVYNFRAHRSKQAIEAAGWVAESASRQDKHGIEAVKLLVEQLGRSEILKRDEGDYKEGTELLRAAIRHIDPKEMQQVNTYLEREFGGKFSGQFENTTYMNLILMSRDLPTYIKTAHLAWRLLASIQALYADSSKVPSDTDIELLMANLGGNLLGSERDEMRATLSDAVKALIATAEAKRTARPRTDGPSATVDVIRTIGTVLSGQDAPLPPLDPQQPLGIADKQALRQSLQAVIAIATRLIRPVPNSLTNQTFKVELRSLTSTLTPDEETFVKERAIILSALGKLMVEIGSGNANKLTDPASPYAKKLEQGTQKPRNALEFLRYLVGHFTRRG